MYSKAVAQTVAQKEQRVSGTLINGQTHLKMLTLWRTDYVGAHSWPDTSCTTKTNMFLSTCQNFSSSDLSWSETNVLEFVAPYALCLQCSMHTVNYTAYFMLQQCFPTCLHRITFVCLIRLLNGIHKKLQSFTRSLSASPSVITIGDCTYRNAVSCMFVAKYFLMPLS